MSHHIDLSEFPTQYLQDEIRRRIAAFQVGRCYYCDKPLSQHGCKLKTQVDNEASKYMAPIIGSYERK